MLDYLPYILLITILFIGSLLEVLGYRKDQMKVVRWGILAFLLFFIGLRFNTGSDWSIYIDNFEKVPTGDYDTQWEAGYLFIMRIVYYLAKSYYVLQFLVTYLLLYSLNKFFTRNTDYPILAISLFVVIFFSSIMMAQVRQSIALSIILLGSKYLFSGNKLKFLLVILVACLFHVSAIVALLLLILNVKINKNIAIFGVILLQILCFFSNLILDFIRLIAPILPSRLEYLINVYMGTYFIQGADIGLGLYYVIMILLFVVFILFSDKIKHSNISYNTLTITIMLYALSKVCIVLDRFLPYFYVFAILQMLSCLDLKLVGVKLRLTRTILFLLIYVFFTIPLLSGVRNDTINEQTNRPNNYGYVPYYNLIGHPKEAEKRLDWYQ